MVENRLETDAGWNPLVGGGAIAPVRPEKKTAEKTSGKFDRACSTTASFDAPSLRSVGQS